MMYQQGVYVAPDPSYYSDALESHIPLLASSGQVHVFVHRMASGRTGLRVYPPIMRVTVDVLNESWIFDADVGALREAPEFGERRYNVAMSTASGGIALFEPDATVQEENERLKVFRKQIKTFEFKYKRGLASVAPEQPTLISLGIGTHAPALLHYLHEHCGLLLVLDCCAWGGYFRSINGSRDAKEYVLAAFATAQVPVFHVSRVSDLPVW